MKFDSTNLIIKLNRDNDEYLKELKKLEKLKNKQNDIKEIELYETSINYLKNIINCNNQLIKDLTESQ